MAAAKRGVKVEILVPENTTINNWCAFHRDDQWPAMIQAGVKIYEYQRRWCT